MAEESDAWCCARAATWSSRAKGGRDPAPLSRYLRAFCVDGRSHHLISACVQYVYVLRTVDKCAMLKGGSGGRGAKDEGAGGAESAQSDKSPANRTSDPSASPAAPEKLPSPPKRRRPRGRRGPLTTEDAHSVGDRRRTRSRPQVPPPRRRRPSDALLPASSDLKFC